MCRCLRLGVRDAGSLPYFLSPMPRILRPTSALTALLLAVAFITIPTPPARAATACVIDGISYTPTWVGTAGNDRWKESADADPGLAVQVLVALGGDDIITASTVTVIVCAGSGDDRVLTGSGDDIIDAGRGVDLVKSRGGNDLVFGGAGPDRIVGGTGSDRIYGEERSDVITGGPGDDYVIGGPGNDRISADLGRDVVYGGHPDDRNAAVAPRVDDDVIRLGDGADMAWGGNGDDLIVGGSGNDQIYGGFGDDSIHGGGGADTLDGGHDADIINGGDGDDVIVGGSGRDRVRGDAGADEISGGAHHDVLDGGEGNDRVFGGDASDVLHGSGGHDYLLGGSGADRITGGEGNDWIEGNDGIDTLRGSAGDDRIRAGDSGDISNDSSFGGPGFDEILTGGGIDFAHGGGGVDSCDPVDPERRPKCEFNANRNFYNGSNPSALKRVDREWGDEVDKWFTEYGVGELADDAVAIMACESAGDPAVGNYSAGSFIPDTPWGRDQWVVGLFQHRLAYWQGRASNAGVPGASPMDPIANIRVTAWMVSQRPESDPFRDFHCATILGIRHGAS